MATRARNFIEKTLGMIFGPAHILTKLLRGSDDSQTDLESQTASLHPLIATNGSFNSSTQHIDGSEGPSHAETTQTSHLGDQESNLDPDLPLPIEGPSRIFVHRNGGQDCLGLIVTEEMVQITQKIASKVQILRKHQSSYDDIEKEIQYAKEQIEKARAGLEQAGEDTAQDLQDFLELEEGNMREAYERRNALARRLEIFKSNLDFAREASHTFLAQVFEEAKLIEPPHLDEEVGPLMNAMEQDDHAIPDADSVASDPKENIERAAARNELFQLMDDLDKAQYEFDGHRAYYHDQAKVYRECVDCGDLPDDRSDFDRKFLAYGQRITRNLIDADEAYKQAKLQAIVLGAVESDWGEPVLAGPLGEWEAQSAPANEVIAYQASRDWSWIYNWMDGITTPDCEAEELQSVEIDEWNARPDDLWESVSVYDCEESSREKIDRWEDIRDLSRSEFLNHERGTALDQDQDQEHVEEQEEDMMRMEE